MNAGSRVAVAVWSHLTILVEEVHMATTMSLSDAKARLSELVRGVRRGEEAVITVDGVPAVRLVPAHTGPRTLTPAEVAGYRALMASLGRIQRPTSEFDAVELVGEGRR